MAGWAFSLPDWAGPGMGRLVVRAAGKGGSTCAAPLAAFSYGREKRSCMQGISSASGYVRRYEGE